jgi:DNA repair protein RecO (recombination protein O)
MLDRLGIDRHHGRVMKQPRERRDDQHGVLHAYPCRETSLIVEAFTETHGRALVARGARRPRSGCAASCRRFNP